MANKKVYHNISESPYVVITKRFVFVFSSEFNKKRFTDKLIVNRDDLRHNLMSRFRIQIEADDYFDLILYYKIEKRGYRVKDIERGEFISCQEQVKLDGVITTFENFND